MFDEERAKREELKTKFSELFNNISEILFKHDPMCINFGINTDEYEPEVGTIIPRLKTCSNHVDVRIVIHQEFMRWFGSICGKEGDYENVAREVWETWLRYRDLF